MLLDACAEVEKGAVTCTQAIGAANRAIVRAASQASKAADYLLGFLRNPVLDPAEPADHEAA
jgi:antirestriction protein ArdC